MATNRIFTQAEIIVGYYLASYKNAKTAFDAAKADGCFKGEFGDLVKDMFVMNSRRCAAVYAEAYAE